MIIRLGADTTEYGGEIRVEGKDSEELGEELTGLDDAIHRTFRRAGFGLIRLGATMQASAGVWTAAAVRLESSFADVVKTVDATDKQLNQLGRSLRQMSARDLPESADSLASLASFAGQLGIEVRNIDVYYGAVSALRGVSLEVNEGELVSLLGPNGAGKTTTLRMIAGILRPTAGRVLLGDEDVHRSPLVAKRRLGYIPDRPFVYDKLTGAEFLRFVAGLYGQAGDGVERRLDELLEVFELSSWKDELVESYSHGMRQKLIISSALIHRPECIVVDEPMVGLDPKAARLLKDIFRQFVERGGTVLMSTHTLEVAEAMCDRIAIIQHGRIVASGTMPEIRAQTAAGHEVGLEELFLKLTGGAHARELAEVLGRR